MLCGWVGKVLSSLLYYVIIRLAIYFLGKDAGYGAFVEASLGRVEGRLGKHVGASIEPNVNTGAGVRNGEASVKFLGFGGSVNTNLGGGAIHTPLGSLKLKLWD